MRVPVEERFWSKVEKTDTCWLWTASLQSTGYGQISVDRRPRLAHRVAYEMLVGPIPAGLELDHLCRNRACVNPDHLEPVTHKVNMLRSPHVGVTHCKKGHEFTSASTYTRPNGLRLCRICQGKRPWAEYRPVLIERMKNMHA